MSLSSAVRKSFVLHRTPWIPKIATKARGMYVELQDGTRLLDGCGGAAVTSVGHGHPEVVKAIKAQYDKLSCQYSYSVPFLWLTSTADIYSMQLSNEPSEALAKRIVDESDGAFSLAAFVCGGALLTVLQAFLVLMELYRNGSHGRCAEDGKAVLLRYRSAQADKFHCSSTFLPRELCIHSILSYASNKAYSLCWDP